MRTVILFTLIVLPSFAQAAVSINEVAWMGSVSSANHEWIELYNSGASAISVDGWTLTDGMNLEIPLVGLVPAKTYVVLERTSDASASGAAFLVYTGALVNTGASLTLRDSSGAIMDQVVGGEDWQLLGGDNVTKETAQYTEAGWVTDVPTPGKLNNPGRTESETEGETEAEEAETENPSNSAGSSNTTSRRPSSNETVRLVTPNTTVTLLPVVQSVAYVNQTIPLTAKASGVGETILNSLQYTWNFGDSHTAFGHTVSHAYQYPGSYVVTVAAEYGRHAPVARHEITVLPTTLSVTRNEAGDVQLHNNAVYDVDVSNFVIRGEQTVTLPQHTIMLPRGTITIASHRLEATPKQSLVGVYDTKRVLVASTFSSQKAAMVEPITPLVQDNRYYEDRVEHTPSPAPVTNPAFRFSSTETVETVPMPTHNTVASETPVYSLTVPTVEAGAGTPNQEPDRNTWPYVALGVLLLAALLVLRTKPKPDTV